MKTQRHEAGSATIFAVAKDQGDTVLEISDAAVIAILKDIIRKNLPPEEGLIRTTKSGWIVEIAPLSTAILCASELFERLEAIFSAPPTLLPVKAVIHHGPEASIMQMWEDAEAILAVANPGEVIATVAAHEQAIEQGTPGDVFSRAEHCNLELPGRLLPAYQLTLQSPTSLPPGPTCSSHRLVISAWWRRAAVAAMVIFCMACAWFGYDLGSTVNRHLVDEQACRAEIAEEDLGQFREKLLKQQLENEKHGFILRGKLLAIIAQKASELAKLGSSASLERVNEILRCPVSSDDPAVRALTVERALIELQQVCSPAGNKILHDALAALDRIADTTKSGDGIILAGADRAEAATIDNCLKSLREVGQAFSLPGNGNKKN